MFSKCSCNTCSGHIEFDAAYAGQTVTCPHCGLETTLLLPAVPFDSPTVPPHLPQEQVSPPMKTSVIPAINRNLRLCADCGKEVSIHADSCPHCGARFRKKRGIFFYVFWGVMSLFGTALIVLFGIGVLAGLLTGNSKSGSEKLNVTIGSDWSWKVIKARDGDLIHVKYKIRNETPYKLVNVKLNVILYGADGGEMLNKTYNGLNGEGMAFVPPNAVKSTETLVPLRKDQSELVKKVSVRLGGVERQNITAIERRLVELEKIVDGFEKSGREKMTQEEDAAEKEFIELLHKKR